MESRPNKRSMRERERATNAQDRDTWHYARKRTVNAKKRAEIERRAFDPAPPTDEDWTVEDPDSDGLHRVTAPVALTDALETLMRRRGWRRAMDSARISSRWQDIVGASLIGRCEPASLDKGVLTVRAASPVWATQLRYMTRQLAERSNEVLAERMVTSVVIVIGDITIHDEPTAEHPAPKGQAPDGQEGRWR